VNHDAPEREPLDFRRLFAGLLLVVLALLFFGMIAPFLEALFLAAVFSAILYPIYERLRRYFNRDGIAALLTTVGGFIVVAIPLGLLVGAISREAIRLSEDVGPIDGEATSEAIVDTLPTWLPFDDLLTENRAAIIEAMQMIVDQIETLLFDTLSRATQGTFAFFLYLFVMLYAIFYFLTQGPALLKIMSEHLPLAARHQREIAQRGIAVTRATLRGVLIIGTIQGVLGGIAMAVAGIEGAAFWALVIAVASTIPVIGTAIVFAPASLVLLVRGDVGAALGLAAFAAIVVGGIDNVLRPYLVGQSARLPDLLVLVSTLGGLAMFGATGLIVGPVLAGLFLTSLNIFIATFRAEFEAASAVPVTIELPQGVERPKDLPEGAEARTEDTENLREATEQPQRALS
jgi:predicted PurR-regulated permease PerM